MKNEKAEILQFLHGNVDEQFNRLRSMSPTHQLAFLLTLENVNMTLNSRMAFEDYVPFQQDMGIMMEMLQVRQPVPEHFIELLVSDLESVTRTEAKIISEKEETTVDMASISFANMLLAFHEIMEHLSKKSEEEAHTLINDFEVEGFSMYFGAIETLADKVSMNILSRLQNSIGK